jgi:hypothetical protein
VSKIDICNLALTRAGHATITALDESSAEATQCGLLYDHCRKETLRAFPWNFAVKVVELAALVDPGHRGHTYRYQLPADCLRPLEILNDDGSEWDMAYRVYGRELHTSAAPVHLEYVANLTDPTKYDAEFISALSYRLAADLAIALAQDAKKQASLMEVWRYMVRRGQVSDAKEERPTTPDTILGARA